MFFRISEVPRKRRRTDSKEEKSSPSKSKPESQQEKSPQLKNVRTGDQTGSTDEKNERESPEKTDKRDEKNKESGEKTDDASVQRKPDNTNSNNSKGESSDESTKSSDKSAPMPTKSGVKRPVSTEPRKYKPGPLCSKFPRPSSLAAIVRPGTSQSLKAPQREKPHSVDVVSKQIEMIFGMVKKK